HGNEQLPTRKAVITTCHDLPIEYIIHARGPVWNGEKKEKQAELAETYNNCLLLAKEHSVTSIAFPSISTGIYHFPINLAAKVALKTVIDFLEKENFGDVVFRSEEHTSELQSRFDLVCRLLLEKKYQYNINF